MKETAQYQKQKSGIDALYTFQNNTVYHLDKNYKYLVFRKTNS